MSWLTKPKVGQIVKVTGGILRDKYGMIVKEYPTIEGRNQDGYGVIVEPSDWPSAVPASYNAIYVMKSRCLELTEEEQTLLKLKFPNPDQFE
jgi:ribosomal protein L14E/L6E/L27E